MEGHASSSPMKVNPAGWRSALNAYHYEVDFSGFAHIAGCKGPPKPKFSGPTDTIEFEAYFRERGQDGLCPWLEVIYWKMFSQPEGRPMRQVRRAKAYWSSRNITPGALWSTCNAYEAQATRQAFQKFLDLFGYSSKPSPIAIAATFPAFVNPDRFPMVDRRVAKWVIEFAGNHNGADPAGPHLRQPEAFARANKSGRAAVLTMSDFDFMGHWAAWCRYTAAKLTRLSQPSTWRARDVEMAVFRAWGSRHPFDSIRLEPLPAPKESDHSGC